MWRPALVLMLAAIVGCTDAPAVKGEWTGQTRGIDRWTFIFDATRDPNDLAGTVELWAGGWARGTFAGTYDHPALTIDLRVTVDGIDPPVEHPSRYHATVNDELDRMEGTMVIEDRTYPLVLRRAQ